MEPVVQIPLTPELTAAVHAGGGFAQVEDPNTHRVYFVIEQTSPRNQTEPLAIDDDYVREKIAEAYADGEFEPLDMAAIKAEFHRRQSLKNLARE